MNIKDVIRNEKALDRWGSGADHHPKSIELSNFLAEIDFYSLCLKFGGDGDNGETLRYLLDAWFESQMKKRPRKKAK